MKKILPFILLLVLVAFIASISSMITRHYTCHTDSTTDAKPELFAQLNLTAEQEKKINVLREQFAASQHHCMQLMQQRNQELGQIILSDKADSPRVQAAVEKIHEAMGDLQKATLNSIFAAKDALTPEQYDKLLQLVAQQLSSADHSCCR